VVAESYVLGFDNRLAILAVLLVLAVTVVWRSRRQAPPSDGVLVVPPSDGTAVSRRTWVLTVAAYALLGLAFHLLVDGLYFTESGYFLRRAKLELAHGRLPWVDFEAAYGPLLLQLPVWIARLGVPLRGAYDLAFLALNLLGLAALAALLRRDEAPLAARSVAFALVAAAAFDLGTGLNYTLARFVGPLLGLLWVAEWLTAAPDGRRWAVRAGLGSTFLLAVAWGLSPEVGLATAAALAVELVLLAGPRWPRRLGAVAIWLLGIALVGVVFPGAYFATFRAFAGGAHQLPVWPAPHVLLYLGALFWAVPSLLGGWRQALASADARAASRVGWGIYAIALVPGALGRADATHALFYGLPVLLWGLARVDRLGSRGRWAARLAFALVFVVAGQGLTLWMNRGLFLSEAWSSLGGWLSRGPTGEQRVRDLASSLGLPADKVDRALARAASGGGLPAALVAEVERCGQVATPLGVEESLEMDLERRGVYVPEYYPDDLNLTTAAGLARKLRDLDRSPCAMVSVASLEAPRGVYGVDPVATERFLRLRLLVPLTYRPLRAPFEPRREVARELREQWRPVATADGWALLRHPPG
jgi:hypothetical protein